MGNDPFTDFITQSGILNLIIAVLVLGVVWVTLFTLAVQRGNERRRRRRAGEPPLPNVFVQLYNTFNNYRQPTTDARSSSKAYLGDAPMPSINDLTNDLPEPDFQSMFTESEADLANYPMPAALPPIEQKLAADIPPDDLAVLDDEPVVDEPLRSGAAYIVGRNELPEDAVEIMRVWRDVTDGSLIIQMGNKVFQTIPELGDRTFAKRFISVVEEMGRTAQAGALALGMPAPDFQKRTAVISQQGDWATRAKPTPAPTTPKRPDATVVSPQAVMAPMGMGSIADQIEELLQFRLMQSHLYQHRSIHVRSNPDGSLRIEVDGRSYAQVEDVIDPDIRDFIRSTIREWEARQ